MRGRRLWHHTRVGNGDEEIGDLSLRQLEHFVAVAEEGTIAAAAARLGYSASAVAASVSELERSFGVQLAVRKRSRGVTLTANGVAVREWARQVLASRLELVRQVRGESEELIGSLRIGCYDTLAASVLPRLLAEFERRHPRVEVDFELGDVEGLLEGLSTGELDAAVLYDMGELGDVDRHLLYQARAYAYVGARHPLASRRTVRLSDLAELPLLLFDRAPSTRHTMAMFAAEGLVPTIGHRTKDFELTRSMVARSHTAYGLFVQRPASSLSYDGLPIIIKEIEPPPPLASVVLAWPRDVERSARARAFITGVKGQDYTDLARPDTAIAAEERA